jgi:hypothetical protein
MVDPFLVLDEMGTRITAPARRSARPTTHTAASKR